ncbi:hypothetical protein D3C80_1696360 [compost metagenome]
MACRRFSAGNHQRNRDDFIELQTFCRCVHTGDGTFKNQGARASHVGQLHTFGQCRFHAAVGVIKNALQGFLADLFRWLRFRIEFDRLIFDIGII